MPIEKEVTIYDIARRLELSSATVSRALKDDPVVSQKTRKKVFDVAEEMGYRINHFARNLRNQRTHTIGVIVPRLNSHFMSTAISGMEHVAYKEGYNLIISQSSESLEKEAVNAKIMFNNRVDGLLVSLASYEEENISHFDVFIKKKVPLIFFDRVEDNDSCPRFMIDNRKAAYDATTHLIKEGCKKIVHITAIPKRNIYRDRLQGYKQALSDNNLKFKKEYIIIDDLSPEAGGAKSAESILSMNPLPDGAFVANDNCAVRCIVALKAAGIRIPQDIAFVGFNNDPVSTVVEPNLTTINNPGYTMGEAAAQNLIDHLNGKATLHSTDTILLRSELIIRDSSRKGG